MPLDGRRPTAAVAENEWLPLRLRTDWRMRWGDFFDSNAKADLGKREEVVRDSDDRGDGEGSGVAVVDCGLVGNDRGGVRNRAVAAVAVVVVVVMGVVWGADIEEEGDCCCVAVEVAWPLLRGGGTGWLVCLSSTISAAMDKR